VLSYGGNKGSLIHPVLYLADKTGSILACDAKPDNFNSADLLYIADNGDWYYIAVDNYSPSPGTFSLCVGGGIESSRFCNNIYCDNDVGVSIGAPLSATGYKLSVHGKVMAEGIKVDLQGRWQDYVFQKDFQLRELPEVKKYTEMTGHLPDVPKASTVEEQGIDLGEMNAVLLKKIEELTLYLIRRDEKLHEQEAQIRLLNQKVQRLKE
jgi:hypothetical protein